MVVYHDFYTQSIINLGRQKYAGEATNCKLPLVNKPKNTIKMCYRNRDSFTISKYYLTFGGASIFVGFWGKIDNLIARHS